MRVKKGPLLAALAVLMIGQGVMNRINYPTWVRDYSPRSGSDLRGLSGDQLLFALTGFREMVAGILWVRADTYFNEGQYDAILPIIRLVTMLDPRQIDVYATGMWHIAYNFTDQQSRSDRRYLSTALALGAEGARNNPQTYELYFETGWLWYHKIDDNYDRAPYWFSESQKLEDIPPARKDILINSMIRNGQVFEAIDVFERLLADANEEYEKDSGHYSNLQIRDTLEANFDNHLVRMTQRGNFAAAQNRYGQKSYDTNPPFDTGFSVRASIVDDRIINIEGSWNVQSVGTRIRVVLRDANFPNAIPAGAEWDATDEVNLEPNAGDTFVQDQLFVRNQAFRKTLDMSRDPVMHPFKSDEYILEFYYNPRSAPAHIQDGFGFNGEGMTDANFLRTDVRPGQRVVYASFKVTADQIWRRGEWAPGGRTPTFRTDNFVELGDRTTENIIQVPNLRIRE